MKRRILIIAALLLALCQGHAVAQTAPVCPGPVFPMNGQDEAITVSNASIGFTAAKISTGSQTAIRADCSIATDNIRYRVGPAPTATVGVLILATSGQFTVCGEQTVKQIRFIRQTTDAALFCTYYAGNP